jgi:1-acyl-sn-glycerol-3-phosphate acyltransferase
MKQMVAAFRSLISYAIAFSLVFGLFPFALMVWLITFPFDKKHLVLHYFSCFWGSSFIWTNPMWRVKITHRDRIKKGKTYILVSNHQSMFDICLIYRLFKPFKWVSKSENYHLPVVGWNLRMNEYIKIERESRKSIMKMMRDCEKAIGEGNSIMMFPEGTRTLDGELRSFKTGAFMLALKTRTPIIPIVIDGSGKVLPKKGLILSANRNIKLNVLEEIPAEKFEQMEVNELKKMTRDIMEEELHRIRRTST